MQIAMTLFSSAFVYFGKSKDKTMNLIQNSYLLVLILILILICSIEAYQKGDRIMTIAQSQHMNTRTSWNDIPLQIVPRFAIDEQIIYHAPIPKYNVNATDYRISTKDDFKVTMSFAFNKFSIPWITIFDASQRRVLRRLKLTFQHNHYEILHVDYELICKFFSSFFLLSY